MSGGGNLSRRSWIVRLSVVAFRPSSSTYFCCSSVNTNGIRSFSSFSSFPFLPTTSAAQARNPAISSSSPPCLSGVTHTRLTDLLLFYMSKSIRIDVQEDGKITRSWVLLFVLMFIVLTSQLEWKEQLESEIESSRPLVLSYKEQHHLPHGKETLQEKKILSQEKNIQKLNDMVQDLRRQLVKCRNENEV